MSKIATKSDSMPPKIFGWWKRNRPVSCSSCSFSRSSMRASSVACARSRNTGTISRARASASSYETPEKSRRTACGNVPTFGLGASIQRPSGTLRCLGARAVCNACRCRPIIRNRYGGDRLSGRTSMSGIHHVTAIAGRAERNLDFFTRVLGLRLVKKTLNFDDPGTYHLYYGDEQGQPGTILTFFPWEHAAAGHLGVGETLETAFRIPGSAIGYWTHRLLEKGVTHAAPEKRFGETVLAFTDLDGMRFALIGVPGAESEN